MRQSIVFVAVALAVLVCCTEGRTIEKRDAYDANLDPALQEVDSDENVRDKRHQDIKFGVKNALLGFVFNKINSFIDQKTKWVDQLDRTNIAKNKQHGIEPPKDPVTSLSGVISGAIGQKLQAAGPLIGVAVQSLTSGSGGLSGGSGGFNIGSLLGGLSSGGGAAGGTSAHAEPSTKKALPKTTTTRKPTTTEDIVIFEKNKPVSLDVPDRLFGSSFTLITNLSETVGDFMINSAERAQRLLESMRPFFWSVFGKKGLVLEVTTDKPIFSDGTSNR